MDFCPECDSLLTVITENGEQIAVCRDCGYRSKNDIPDMSARKISVASDKAKEMLTIDGSDNRVAGRARKEMFCGGCDANSMVEYWEIQTRSADESPTRFFHCLVCDKNWREYD